MSCKNNNDCGCKRTGGVHAAPPCNCAQHDECEGTKCSEIIDAGCVVMHGYEVSVDGGNTFSDNVPLSDIIIAIANNNLVINS